MSEIALDVHLRDNPVWAANCECPFYKWDVSFVVLKWCGGIKLNEEDVLQSDLRINVECKHFYPLCCVDWSIKIQIRSCQLKSDENIFHFWVKLLQHVYEREHIFRLHRLKKRIDREKNLQMLIFFSYLCKVSANFTQMQWKNLPAITLRFQLPLKKFTAIKLALRSCGNIYIKINYFVCPTYFGT